MNPRLSTSCLFAALLLPAAGLAAGSLVQPEQLRARVSAYLEGLPPAVKNEARRVVTVSRIDPRIRLAACSRPLQMQLAGQNPRPVGRVTVVVACAQPEWRIRVPARVAVHAPVVVAATPLAARTRLDKSHLKLEDRDISTLHAGMFTDIASLIGAELRYPLAAGRVITPAQIVPDYPVHKNGRVRIVSGGSGYRVEVAGVALENGGKGERIRVRNLRSGRVLEGRVIGRDQVQVGPPPPRNRQ